ncbi:hypothetical protein [Bacillus toyonensis]|uniref:hypothetical protein n=1 Tax=Bacillus toyonensis TaxID=155322 RepID=UPI002E22C83E|nr:hypothetical protein [Bacillus toyonensis]
MNEDYTLDSHAIPIDGTPIQAFASHRPRASEIAKQYALTNPLSTTDAIASENNTIVLIAHLQAASDDPNFRVEGQELSRTLAIKMLHKLNMGFGQVGTGYDMGVLGSKKGDYDMALKGLMVIAYRYRHLLTQDDLDFILDKLVPSYLSGSHDPSLESYTVFPTESVPETENHMLMINSTKYLVNQLLFDRTGNLKYDNKRNGLKNWLLGYMQTIAKHDFLEFNARPYQRLSLHALFNLYEFSKDKSIKDAAQILLDYTMVKFAISSNRQRRICPFRRLKEYSNLPSNEHNELLGPQGQGRDAVIGFFLMYVGPTDINGNPINKFPVGWAFEAIIAGLAAYRPPVAAYNLAMKREIPTRAFQHRFYHGLRPKFPGTDDQPDGGLEIYYSSPSFLLTAGGMFLNSGYGGDEWFFIKYKDTAIAQSTTLLPTQVDVKFADLIRFDPYPDERRAVNTAVHSGFACGANLRPCEKKIFHDSTTHSPSLSSHAGRLYLSWKGSGNQNLNISKVYVTEKLDIHGIEDLEDKRVLGDTSEQSPSLVSHSGRLYLAWKGAGNDNLNLMFSDDNGATFHSKKTFKETSHHSPVLVSHGGRLFIAWTGRGEGNLNVAKVVFFGNTAGGFGIEGLEDKVVLNDTSEQSPSLASHNDRLYLSWKGAGNDNLNLMFSDDNGANFHGKKTFKETSHHSPVLASHGGRLFIAWTGRGEGNLNVAKVVLFGNTSGEFAIEGLEDKVVLNDTSEQSPSLASHNGRLYLSWKGAGNDNLNLFSSQDGVFQLESWHFCDLSRFGLYVAIYRTPPERPDLLDTHLDNLGLLYAYDLKVQSNPMSFETFKQLTKRRNATLPVKLDYGGHYMFHTADNHRFYFWLHPSLEKYRARIYRMDDVDIDNDFSTLPLVEGPFLNTPNGHDGLIEIRHPNCDIPLVLDFRNMENPIRQDNMPACSKIWLERAHALHLMAVRLIQAGRKNEVVGLAREAVQLYRQLAVLSGKNVMIIARYLLDLSFQLCNGAGLCGEALEPARVAVDLLRGFQPPSDKKKEHLELLAYALYILTVRLIQAGRKSEAVGPARETVQLYRQLAVLSGADVMMIVRYLLDLSSQLCNGAGLCDEAVEPARVAVDLLRGFQPPSDKKKEHLELLAYALYILTVRLIQAGRKNEAVDPARETVQLYRQLAVLSGADVMVIVRYLLDLSSQLCNGGGLCGEAVEPIRAAVDLLRGFQPPSDKEKDYLELFAYAVYILAVYLQTVGRINEAIIFANEAVQVYRCLASMDPYHYGPFLQSAEQLIVSLMQC